MIEVVVGSALCGMLLTGAVMAKIRLEKQRTVLARRQAAVEAADRLLTQWYSAPSAVPVAGEGRLTADGLMWRVAPARDAAPAELQVVKVAFEVLEEADPSAGPLWQVDLLVPLPPPKKEAP